MASERIKTSGCQNPQVWQSLHKDRSRYDVPLSRPKELTLAYNVALFAAVTLAFGALAGVWVMLP